ncbi:MAG TPA: vitamin K epoxide reductase family protein [Solirubrobacterales bacterium]|nr:vitamin K epoxide reductase family protein [Solirubrobacterales bacterium]
MPSEQNLRLAAGALAIAGIGVATYIAIAEGGGGSPKCLVGGGGCETVAESRYSELAGINVAVIGIVGYAILLIATIVPGDVGRFGGFLTALIGVGFSLYLTYLELFVIEAICQWCVASAVLMTLSLVVAAARAFAYTGAELTPPQIQSQHGR